MSKQTDRHDDNDNATTKVVDRVTWGTHGEAVEVLDLASTAGEGEGARASLASHRIRSSSDHVLHHRSLQGAVAYAADIQELPAAVASLQDSEGTSFQGDFGVEGSRSRGP